MSRVAEWMRERYVEPMAENFYFEHGRWPSAEEEKPMWDAAFKLAERDQKIERLELD